MILLVALEDCRMYQLHHISRCKSWPNQTSGTEITIFSINNKSQFIWGRRINRVLLHRQWIWTTIRGQSCTLSWVLVIWRACDWPLFEVPGTVQRTGSRAISQSLGSDSAWGDTPSSVDLQGFKDTLDQGNSQRDRLVFGRLAHQLRPRGSRIYPQRVSPSPGYLEESLPSCAVTQLSAKKKKEHFHD